MERAGSQETGFNYDFSMNKLMKLDKSPYLSQFCDLQKVVNSICSTYVKGQVIIKLEHTFFKVRSIKQIYFKNMKFYGFKILGNLNTC